MHFGVLTSDSGLQYRFLTGTNTVTAVAPAPFDDGNVREAFWNGSATMDANAQECMTWNSTGGSVPGGPIQPGVALRIAPTGANNQGIKAVTVTENVWYYGVWIFNVHVWDSTLSQPFTQIDSFDLSPIVGKVTADANGNLTSTLVAPPWHVCAAAIGNQFLFKVWTGTNPEPAWDDPTHVFTTTLPDGWDYPGLAGGYIGHLKSDLSATFSDMNQTSACSDAVLALTQACQDATAQTTSSTTTSTAPTSTSLPSDTTSTTVDTTSTTQTPPTSTLPMETTTTLDAPAP